MAEGSTPRAETYEDADALRERLKERIYASISLLAVLVALAQGGHSTHWAVVASVGVTALGLWLATLIADLQSLPVAHGRLPHIAEIRHMLFTSSPLLTTAIGPLLMTGLSAVGLMGVTTALWISVASELTTLAAWGFAGARRIGAGLLGGLVIAGLNATLGLAVVGVKLLVAH
ncbi:hypothetical protein [Streptomyces mesophilus]|uniref:hypothetical protein n=1 Tax=Streptomyces mesophilus TaxID=1775132 RepID=UPI003318AAEA